MEKENSNLRLYATTFWKRFCLILIILIAFAKVNAQIKYTTANAHSHNDYENYLPFITAYQEKFGSIEADIFLWNDSLIVGHTFGDIKYKRTLENLYLNPLNKNVIENNGYPYKNASLELQLLIDIKTAAIPTIAKLVKVLSSYPTLIQSKKIKFVITGNRPDVSLYNTYPSFILFDGELDKIYPKKALTKVPLFSDDLKKYTNWNGTGTIPTPDKLILDSCINKAHQLNKKIRFWDAPDVQNAWQQFINLKVDYLNTDHIAELSNYLNQKH